MANKRAQFTVKGMSRDLAVSKFNPEFAFENKNLRLIATDDNTTFSLVNEKGNIAQNINWNTLNDVLPTPVEGNFVFGTPIGQCILNNNLILFTAGESRDTNINFPSSQSESITASPIEGISIVSDTEDNIYKFWFDGNTFNGIKLFQGELNLDETCPIETLGIYENENLQKVYWVDGRNQPRIINVTAGADTINSWDNNSFNFVGTLNLQETVEIEKTFITNGLFAPGVIQYCFTYYDLYGRQTNIFYTSPLYYLSFKDRGANSTETVSNSFTIRIENLDHKYSRVRIYSLYRTSIDTTPVARVVGDVSIPADTSASITYVDNGISGYTIDPTELLYIGGKELVAKCLAQKDNTLFLGNLHVKTNTIPSHIKTAIRNWSNGVICTNDDADDAVEFSEISGSTGYYLHENQLQFNSQQISGFKNRDYYRVGIQFQDTLGNWSEACYIGDKLIDVGAHAEYNGTTNRLTLHPVKIKLTITTEASSIIQELKDLGYIKARPVIIYPTLTDRSCICQGVVNSTVFNVEDRYNNAPFAQASWFFRPNAPVDVINSSTSSYVSQQYPNFGKWLEFRHFFPIPGCRELNSEIQCISLPPRAPLTGIDTEYKYVTPSTGKVLWKYTESTNPLTWTNENRECYYIDQSIVTLNSPEIDFNTEIQNLNLDGAKFRILGAIKLAGSVSDIDIQAQNIPLQYSKGENDTWPEIAPGFYKESIGAKLNTEAGVYHGWKSIISGVFWLDEFYKSKINNSERLNVGFVVYPWHRNGSLNNTRTVGENEVKSSLLLKKKLSILRYSFDTYFLNTPWDATDHFNTKSVIYNLDTTTPIKLQRQTWDNWNTENSECSEEKEITYQGNIDKVLLFHATNKGGKLDSDPDARTSTLATYPIVAARFNNDPVTTTESTESNETTNFRSNLSSALFTQTYGTLKDSYYQRPTSGDSDSYIQAVVNYVTFDVPAASTDPVSIKYKSTPHAVIAFDDSVHNSGKAMNLLPVKKSTTAQTGMNRTNWSSSDPSQFIYWDENYNYYSNLALNEEPNNIGLGFLYLGELYKDVDTTTIFGGNTEEALENAIWTIGGPSVDLSTTNNVTVKWKEGDTYYQRYDCLKTYPFTMEDQNSIVDILSFMCETRINLDGRYDRNRGLTSNLYMSPLNFNLLNTAYSQRNNFFSYKSFNSNKLNIENYPNIVTFSKTKTLGEEIDTWTNVTLASSLELDGDKGQVRALKTLNDTLLAFQDSGISQILYNDNVQVASTTGVPIEIANSGKVSGKRYISNQVGCTNKWSICTTPAGIYFVDDRSKDIYLFNGQINDLSDKLGFRSWMMQNFKDIKVWNPKDFDGIVTYYDSVNQDVLFISKDQCLAYNEALGNFSSFYSYEHVPYFSNIKDRGIAWQKAVNDSYYRPWLHHEGEYNKFFGVYQPFWTTVIVNPGTTDKIFNNIEFRADSFDDGAFKTGHTFDHLRTWNEYQEGLSELTNTLDRPSTLKKKFRIWHANIPRWNVNKNGLPANYRDRMRNPWLYLKLSMENTSNLNTNYKTVLHDLAVDYTE